MINLLIFLLAIASGVTIFIPAYPIIINQNGTGFKRITYGGYVLIFCVVLLIFLPLLLNHFQNLEDKKRERKQTEAQNYRDSALRHDYAASILEIKNSYAATSHDTDSTISENLGKYGFKFDSVNKRLLKVITDSAKTRVIVSDAPVISIADLPEIKAIQFMGDDEIGHKYRINIMPASASSSFFKIKTSIVIQDRSGPLNYIDTVELLSFNDQLIIGCLTTSFFWIPKKYDPEIVIIWFRGEYRNIDNTKSYSVDQVHYYNSDGKTDGIVRGTSRQKIIAFVKRHE